MKLIPGTGPIPARVVLLGEAPGATEELYGRPFIGEAGEELDRQLEESGIPRSECYVTNVFKVRPPSNKVEEFFTSRSDPEACTDLPSFGGKYLRDAFRDMVSATRNELLSVEPTLCIALGRTALWFLLGQSKIGSFVGTLHPPADWRTFHTIPTYHPAGVLRQWSWRPIVLANLAKAKDFLDTAGRVRSTNGGGSGPRFRLKTNLTLAEVRRLTKIALQAPELAVDIETARGQIRTIAFAWSALDSFCISFWEPPAEQYWPDLKSELAAWDCVKLLLGNPDSVKIFHNGAYDIQYLWRGYGIPVAGPVEDTMLLHHALEPELPKGLGPLAATYLSIPEWKTARVQSDKEEE